MEFLFQPISLERDGETLANRFPFICPDTRGTVKQRLARFTRIHYRDTASRARRVRRGSRIISTRSRFVQRKRNTSRPGRLWTTRGTGCTWWTFRTRTRSIRKLWGASDARESRGLEWPCRDRFRFVASFIVTKIYPITLPICFTISSRLLSGRTSATVSAPFQRVIPADVSNNTFRRDWWRYVEAETNCTPTYFGSHTVAPVRLCWIIESVRY